MSSSVDFVRNLYKTNPVFEISSPCSIVAIAADLYVEKSTKEICRSRVQFSPGAYHKVFNSIRIFLFMDEMPPSKRVLFLIGVYFLKYVAYWLLSTSVIFVFTSILIFLIYVSDGALLLEFIKYLSFINSNYSSGSFGMEIFDIMQIFSYLSILVWIILYIIKRVIEKIIKKEIILTLGTKIKAGLIGLTSVLIVDLLCITFFAFEEGLISYTLFLILYVASAFTYILYALIYWFSEKILYSLRQ